MTIAAPSGIKVADEVWIATALLHREHPKSPDFTIDEIRQRVAKLSAAEPRSGVYVHIVQHCVANRAPSPGRYRMLVETAQGRRRLFRTGDSYHVAREGSKTHPLLGDLPEKYRSLLDWYQRWQALTTGDRYKNDPLLAAVGIGKHLRTDEDPDEYVRRLREGWE
ncbi:MAG TPA: hypothetical protein VMI10_22735 [Terriglobales bacterium]|nr:hypothetical protein [Terriglobales bacterium]